MRTPQTILVACVIAFASGATSASADVVTYWNARFRGPRTPNARLRTTKSLLAWVPILVFIMGCGGSSSPTSPTPTPLPTPAPTPAPAPAPVPGTVSLTGRVTDLATNGGLSGATVLILDGANAGSTVTTNSDGDYRFDALQSGNANLSANAAGYVETRASVLINGTNVLDFVLWMSVLAPRSAPARTALPSISRQAATSLIPQTAVFGKASPDSVEPSPDVLADNFIGYNAAQAIVDVLSNHRKFRLLVRAVT